MVKTAAEIWRDKTNPSDPSSEDWKPVKSEIREWGTVVEMSQAGGLISKRLWSELNAISPTQNGTAGEVIGPDAGTHTDPVSSATVANEGRYSFVLGTGWNRIGDNLLGPIADTIASLGTMAYQDNVVLTDIEDIPAGTVLGRKVADGSGPPLELTGADVLALSEAATQEDVDAVSLDVRTVSAHLAGYGTIDAYDDPISAAASNTGTQFRGTGSPCGVTGGLISINVYGMVAGTGRFYLYTMSGLVATIKAIIPATIVTGYQEIVPDEQLKIDSEYYISFDAGSTDSGARLSGGLDGYRTSSLPSGSVAVGDTFTLVASPGGAPQIQLTVAESVKADFNKFVGMGSPTRDVTIDVFPNRVSSGNLTSWDTTGTADGRFRMDPWSVVAGEKYTVYYYLYLNEDETPNAEEEFRLQFSTTAGSSSGVSDYTVATPNKWGRAVITISGTGNYSFGTRAIKVRGGWLYAIVLDGDVKINPKFLSDNGLEHLLSPILLSGVASLDDAPADGEVYGRQNNSWVVASGGSSLKTTVNGFIRQDNTVYFDPYKNLTSTTPFGFSSVSGLTRSTNTVTLTGASAYLNLNSEIFPSGRKHMAFEAVMVVGAAQKFKTSVRNLSGAVMCSFEFSAADNTITVSGLGITTATLSTPASLDIDSVNGLNVCLLMLPNEHSCRLWLRYYNSAGADNLTKQVSWFSDAYTWTTGTYPRTNEARGVQVMTDATGSGTVVITDPALFEPSFWNVGSSIVAGSDNGNGGYQFSPYPGFYSRYRDWDEAFLRGRAIGKWGLNAGVASGGISGVNNVLPLAVWAKANVIAGDFGLTNNINNLDYSSNPTTNRTLVEAALLTIVNTIKAANAVAVIDEVIPRDWTSTASDAVIDAEAQAINATMAGWAGAGNCVLVKNYTETLGTGILPSVAQCPDGTHPGSYGKMLRLERFLRDLGSATVFEYKK